MSKTKRKGKMMWGFIYVGTFIAIFLASALVKMKADPFHGKYRVDWCGAVGTVYTDVPYGDGPANKFDLYVPADKTKDSYGLIVYLHAGGFTVGDKSGDGEMLQWLCAKGYVTAGINYTLFSENDPAASVYSQTMDIKNALPHVATEAEKRGYKLDRMAIAGGSAGGTLALVYAYRDADTSPVPVKMVFEMVGPASFYREDWTNYGLDQSPEAAANLFGAMSGTKLTPEMILSGDYLEAVKPISADRWVKENSVPALIAYGKHDKVCPYLSAGPLVAALEEHHVPYDYFEFPHSGHGLQNDNKIYAAYMNRLEEYLDQYMASPAPGPGGTATV